MRHLAIGGFAGLLAALVVALAVPTDTARSAATAELSVRSGDLVAFEGTSLQCLVFGPIARVEGKHGVLCFKGRPRQHATGTRWIAMTPRSIFSSGSVTRDFRSITSAASIQRVVRASTGTTLTVAGLTYANKGRTAQLGCRYQRIAAIDADAKGVLCADVANGMPLPDSYGFLLTQGLAATLTYGANGSVKVDTRWRLPRCACDK